MIEKPSLENAPTDLVFFYLIRQRPPAAAQSVSDSNVHLNPNVSGEL